jgi:hypothetical protein
MDEHTVFESEVVGAILALDIIKGTPRLTDVDIFKCVELSQKLL